MCVIIGVYILELCEARFCDHLFRTSTFFHLRLWVSTS